MPCLNCDGNGERTETNSTLVPDKTLISADGQPIRTFKAEKTTVKVPCPNHTD